MAKYKIFFRKSVFKDFRPIPKKQLQSIVRRIDGLAEDPRPRGCEKLSGKEQYRIRQGTYRIIYSIEDEKLIVEVVKVAHRREAYR